MGSKIELINCFGDWLTKARDLPRLDQAWEDSVITSLKYVIVWFMFFMIACRHLFEMFISDKIMIFTLCDYFKALKSEKHAAVLHFCF